VPRISPPPCGDQGTHCRPWTPASHLLCCRAEGADVVTGERSCTTAVDGARVRREEPAAELGLTRANACPRVITCGFDRAALDCVTVPDPVAFGLALTPAPTTIRMCIRSYDPPGGPPAEPKTNWDDVPDRSCLPSVREVSIPPDDGVADRRRVSIPTILEWTASGTEKFLGRDMLLSLSSLPRQRQTWPDPVNLFGAATCGRTNPNLSGARRIRGSSSAS